MVALFVFVFIVLVSFALAGFDALLLVSGRLANLGESIKPFLAHNTIIVPFSSLNVKRVSHLFVKRLIFLTPSKPPKTPVKQALSTTFERWS